MGFWYGIGHDSSEWSNEPLQASAAQYKNKNVVNTLSFLLGKRLQKAPVLLVDVGRRHKRLRRIRRWGRGEGKEKLVWLIKIMTKTRPSQQFGILKTQNYWFNSTVSSSSLLMTTSNYLSGQCKFKFLENSQKLIIVCSPFAKITWSFSSWYVYYDAFYNVWEKIVRLNFSTVQWRPKSLQLLIMLVFVWNDLINRG